MIDTAIERLGFTSHGSAWATRPYYVQWAHANRAQISVCRFTNINGTGSINEAVRFDSCLDIEVRDNTLESIGGSSSLNLDVYAVTAANIVCNRARNCSVGIGLHSSPYGLIDGNTLIGSQRVAGGVPANSGVQTLAGCNRTIVSNNQIDNARWEGGHSGILVTDCAR